MTPTAATAEPKSSVAKKPTSSIDQAVDRADDIRNEDTRIRDERTNQAWTYYVKYLSLGEKGLTDEQSRELSEIVVELERTREQVQVDCEAIHKVRKLADLHADTARSRDEPVRMRRELIELRKQADHQIQAAETALHLAQQYSQRCTEANYELGKLRSVSPRLFIDGSDPPRLRCADDQHEAKSVKP